MIVGIDEVGRGCWAGPLVVSAVALGGAEIPGLTDSKKLTPKQREALALQIRHQAVDIGIGWISNKLVDEHGLTWALKQASRLALTHITAKFDEIIIDGNFKFVNDPRATTMIKADLLVPSVSAASIIAKVARDRYMYRMHRVFSNHGFNTHVGYGTVGHQSAIKKFGVTPLHRLSWAPLAEFRSSTFNGSASGNGAGILLSKQSGTVEDTSGFKAEREAADFLKIEGFQILQQNWRTKWCEIDIVAEKNGIIHFVEVKYRRSDYAGDGIAAITPRKLKQMKFSAELWQHRYGQKECRLSVVALKGDPIEIDRWLPDVN
jgi:ribonuclease HII